MTLPWQFWRSLQDSRALPIELEQDVSLTLADGTPMKWNTATGKLTPVSNNTDQVAFILNGASTTSAVGTQVNQYANPPVINQIGNGYNSTAGPGGNPSVQSLGGYATFLPAQNNMGIWRMTFTPVIKNFVSNTTGSPYSIILPNCPNTYAANAFQGGTLYCSSLNQQVRITASSAVTATNPITFTIVAPLGQPGATVNADGLTFSATPLGPTLKNIKFDTSSGTVANSGYIPSQLGVGSADYSGGFLQVFEVDIQNGYVFAICN
jgi:hypothetical protein